MTLSGKCEKVHLRELEMSNSRSIFFYQQHGFSSVGSRSGHNSLNAIFQEMPG
jgi:hypothetical protein